MQVRTKRNENSSFSQAGSYRIRRFVNVFINITSAYVCYHCYDLNFHEQCNFMETYLSTYPLDN